MAHNPDSAEPHKRKRDISDDNGNQPGHAADRIPQPPPPQSGTFIIHPEVHDNSSYAVVKCIQGANGENGMLLLEFQLRMLLSELAWLVESRMCLGLQILTSVFHTLPISEIQIYQHRLRTA